MQPFASAPPDRSEAEARGSEAAGYRITELMPGFAPQFGRLVALLVLSAISEGAGLLMLVPMLTVLGHPVGGTGRVAMTLHALGIPLSLGPLLAIFVALVVVRAIVAHLRALSTDQLQLSVVDTLRGRAWTALLHADWRLLVAMRHSENLSQLLTSIERVGYGVRYAVAGLTAAITLLALGAATLIISPMVAIAAALAGAGVLLAYRRLRRRASVLGERLGKAHADVHEAFTEGLRGIKVIKSFSREDFARDQAQAGFERVRWLQLSYRRDLGFGQILLQGGGAAVLALLVWLGVTRWGAGLATVVPLVALFARALPLLGSLQESWQNWAHARPALTSVASLIELAEAHHEGPREGPRERGGAALRQEITLEAATVRFEASATASLEEADLVVRAGSCVALTGPSGAGKSTLADLVGGLIAPDAGSVAIDGMALDGGSRRAWRAHVAYVQQEPVLFSGSVRDNLLWAAPEADEARLRRALEDASAGFVHNLPLGLDSDIGEGGRRLSGGERQRLALARALLRDPALLILDEATSALDAANEAAIAAAIERLKGRMTIVIIGHRGALAGLADAEVALEAGRIVSVTRRDGA
ncbi:MAG: ABC transporter ATP-binding protein [Novosphingobium sp.]|nr:ABC transporter ATP-binding protein [Novosphingobium sp.]